MNQFLGRLPASYRLSTAVIVAAGAVGVSAAVVAYGITAVAGTLMQPSISEDEADPLAALARDSAEELERSRKRFEGRSVFVLPSPPPRKQRPTEIVKAEPPPPPPPVTPPVPSSYGGPQPSSVLGEFVFFPSLTDEDKRIKIGETKAGITVLEVYPPYSVKLGYQRGEFTVSLWPKIDDRILKGASGPWRAGNLSGTGTASANGTGADSAAALGSAGSTERRTAVVGGATGSAGTSKDQRAIPRPAVPAGANANPIVGGGSPEPRPDEPEDEPGEQSRPLPSAAMLPQKFPPPNSGGGQGDEAPTPEYVDRELLPPRLEESQINSMTREQAQSALNAINATDQLSVDDHSRARLDHERELLRARLRRNP
jgi:hypothetical protein